MPTVQRRRGSPSTAPLRSVKAYAQSDIENYFSWCSVGQAGSDGELRIFCPMCEDPTSSRSPSASINAAKGEWNCLKSSLDEPHGGLIEDLLTWLKTERGMNYGGATAQRPALSSRVKPKLPPEVEHPELATEDWFGMLRSVRFASRLEYLTVERGLRRKTLDKFQVGYDGQRYTVPIRSGVDGPIRNVKKYRRNGQQKWISIKGHGSPSMVAFTSELAENSHPVIFCAGEFDAMLTNQRLEGHAVAVTGTGGEGIVPPDLSPLRGREVFVAYDCDDAGRAGSTKLATALRKVGATAHILDLTRFGLPFTESKGADLTTFWQKHGGTPEQFRDELARVRSESGVELRERFKLISAADLAQPVPPMEWLVKGVWPAGSYGTLAGEKKTLKTYTDLALALAVASGQPFLGHFTVPEPRPVLMYLGEGGQMPTMHRLQRIAAAMGLDLASLPLRIVFDAGDITGEEFLASLRRAVATEKPGLVIVDPFYAFHPPGIEAQNLYSRGAMLADVQQSMPSDCAFVLADHFRKTGSKDLDLDSIAQSGVSQWADSWILQNHNSPPRVDAGQFSIGMQFGSRQWGGRQYVVDWSLGIFNDDSGEHEGDLTYTVRSVGWGESTATSTRAQDVTSALILTLLESEPLVHTMSAVRDLVRAEARVGTEKFAEVWGGLVASGHVVSAKALGTEGKNRERWKLSGDALPKVKIVHSEDES